VRRLLSIATIAIATVFLFAASLPAPAQMRGGGRGAVGHGGGGHGGFAGRGGFGGHMGGSHAFGGMHSGPGFAARGFNRGFASRQPAFRGNRFRGDRFREGRFREHRFRDDDDRFRDRRFHDFDFGRWGGWPWWFAGSYDPDWWDSGSSYDEDRAREIELANEMNQQSLAEQRMRREQDQDLYARSDPPQHPDPPPQHAEERTESTPATVLIFRDERKREVQNYAVVGQTLWVFEPQRTEKIPLSQLDIPATAKANDERGVDFHLSAAGEGQ
jgi:hypothetical protein